MKKFIKKNKVISVFGFISATISISYAITYNMPDYFGIESWYSLLNNISISYIAALLFYILQVYKPERENAKKSQKILHPLFVDLVKFMEIAIACCRKYVSLDKDNKIKICWDNEEKSIIYFVPINTGDPKNNSSRPAIRKTKDELMNSEKNFKSKIKEIKERIDFRWCDSDILDVFSKLESTDFFKNTVSVALIFEKSFITFPTFKKDVDEFELIKDELKKSCKITCNYNIRDANPMEIAAAEAIFNQNALLADSADSFNEITYKTYLHQKLEKIVPDKKRRNTLVNELFDELAKNGTIKSKT